MSIFTIENVRRPAIITRANPFASTSANRSRPLSFRLHPSTRPDLPPTSTHLPSTLVDFCQLLSTFCDFIPHHNLRFPCIHKRILYDPHPLATPLAKRIPKFCNYT